MKTERDLFEDLPYIKSRLDDVFFIDEENTYLPHQWDDADSVNNMHFINGAWYSWQARVPEGYVVVPVDPTEDMIMAGCMEHGGYDVIDSKSIYKAMIGASE